jgi:hypothetical protein
LVITGGGVVAFGTQAHSVIHQSGCNRSAFGSLENGYWLYSHAYCDVSVMVVGALPPTATRSGAVMPPPVGASGMLYRTVIEFAAFGSVNSTYWPGVSLTAVRPDASEGSVYAVRSGPMTTPSVVAFSASCSAKSTVAPRPATNAGSSAARVTTGVDPSTPANADWAPPSIRLRLATDAVATAAHRDGPMGRLAMTDIE